MAWLTGWSYRKSHDIHAATGAGTDYQIQITVHAGAGSDSVGDVYLNSHGVDASFGDIRFTDDDGNTELDYWMVSHVDSNNAVFWVKVDDSLETNPQTIYIYYGKASTSTTSSAVNTLIYYHDFEGETVGQPPTKFLETTNLTIQADTVEGTRCVKNSGAGNGPFERMDMVNNAGVCLDAKMKNSGNFQAAMCLRYIDGNNYIKIGGIYGNPANYWGVGQLVGGVWSETHTAFTWGTGWHDIKVLIYNSSVTATIDGGNSVTKSGLTLLSAGKGAVRQWNSVTAWFDYIRIRKYCNPEPVQHLWGSEETPSIAHYVTVTELLGVLDSKTRVKTINRTITELSGLLDTKTQIHGKVLTITELLGLTDTKSTIHGKFKTIIEILGLLDTKSRVKSAYRTFTELLGLTDTKSTIHGKFKTITELLGLIDTKSRVKSINRTFTELLGLLDTKSRLKKIYRIFAESLGLLDSKTRIKSYYRTIVELLGLKDSKSRIRTINRTIIELLGLTDIKSRSKSVYRTFAELLGLTDTKTTIHGRYKTVTEILGLSDTKSRIRSIKRTIIELLGLKDSKSRVKTINRTITELLGLKDVQENTSWHALLISPIGPIMGVISEILFHIRQPIFVRTINGTIVIVNIPVLYSRIEKILGIENSLTKEYVYRTLIKVSQPIKLGKSVTGVLFVLSNNIFLRKVEETVLKMLQPFGVRSVILKVQNTIESKKMKKKRKKLAKLDDV
jgi:hypothetical protein